VRIFNRLLAFVFALAIAAAAVITVIEVIAQRAFSRGPVVIDWRAMLRWGQRNTWQAFSVELACGAMAVIGLILLMLQLKRRRPNKVSLRAADANNSVALTRKGTAATVRSAVLDVEGISAATVKVEPSPHRCQGALCSDHRLRGQDVLRAGS
jgi:hypothetical protein